MRKKGTRYLTQGALIASVYVVLSIVFAAFGSGQIQVRLAEALTILPVFTPAAVPGLFIGCLVSNLIMGGMPVDVVFGSIATLIGAMGTRAVATRLVRISNKGRRLLAPIPPILANGIIVPLILIYGYGINLPFWVLAVSVGAGETISCGILGLLLERALYRYADKIFR